MVVHVPIRTTIYIDDGGADETRTIMRAELAAMYTALTTFATHVWIGTFIDSLSSPQAIRHTCTNPEVGGLQQYHHHSVLLGGTTNQLEDKRRKGFSTNLHKIKAHMNIRSNDLADAAAKLMVTHYESYHRIKYSR